MDVTNTVLVEHQAQNDAVVDEIGPEHFDRHLEAHRQVLPADDRRIAPPGSSHTVTTTATPPEPEPGCTQAGLPKVPAGVGGVVSSAAKVVGQVGRTAGILMLPGSTHSQPGNVVRRQLWIAAGLDAVGKISGAAGVEALGVNSLVNAGAAFGLGLFSGHFQAGTYIPKLPKVVQPLATAVHEFGLQVGGVLAQAHKRVALWCERPGAFNRVAGAVLGGLGRVLPLDPRDPRQCVAAANLATGAFHLARASLTQDPVSYALAGLNIASGLGMTWFRPTGQPRDDHLGPWPPTEEQAGEPSARPPTGTLQPA